MPSDRERWDLRYSGEDGEGVRAPDPFALEALERLGPGAGRTALDLAAGTGRHALELARRGWRASAWDVSPIGLGILAERARAEGLSVATGTVDLTALSPEPPRFDLVLSFGFLHRPLLPELARLVVPGGHLVFATATVDRDGERPPLRFCLGRGELARGLAGFETLLEREADGRAGLMARRIG